MRTVTFSEPAVGKALENDFVCAWKNRIDGFHDCEPATENWIFQSNAEAYTTRNICTFFLTPDLQVLHYVSGYYAPPLYLDEIKFAEKLRGELFDDDFKAKPDAQVRFKEIHAARALDLKELAGRFEGSSDAQTLKRALDGLGALQYNENRHTHTDACLRLVAGAYAYVAQADEDLATGGKGCGQDHATVAEDSVAKRTEDRTPKPLQTVWINATREPKPLRTEPRKEMPSHEARTVAGIPVLSQLQKDYVYGNPFAEEQRPTRRLKRTEATPAPAPKKPEPVK